MIRTDIVEVTHIGGNNWTVQRFDIVGQPGQLYQIHTRAAARVLARCEARQLDLYCEREDLAMYIDERC